MQAGATRHIYLVRKACTSYTCLHNTYIRHIEIGTVQHLPLGSRAHARTHARCPLSVPLHRPSGVGLKWLQYCGRPVTIYLYIRRLEMKNHSHTGSFYHQSLKCNGPVVHIPIQTTPDRLTHRRHTNIRIQWHKHAHVHLSSHPLY